MADERVWVWFERSTDAQHLATPPDATTMSWDAETACGLDGAVRRVTYENVDAGSACPACTAEPFTLAGDDRGPP